MQTITMIVKKCNIYMKVLNVVNNFDKYFRRLPQNVFTSQINSNFEENTIKSSIEELNR